ncbi:MAG: 2-amino-4-hydroxy-6-hydroxymethyldihydropteridine diphosphokinase [Verrucomicrobiales bacterium]
MPRAGLSLGSNLGNRLANLREAVDRLDEARSTDHLLVSSIYETEAVGCGTDSPDFLNAVVEIETELTPEALMDFLQNIETAMGRALARTVNAPREIDLDILYYDDLKAKTARLEIPHPRMNEREFVLRPLAEIRPDLVGSERLEKVAASGSAVVKFPEPLVGDQNSPSERT